MNEPKQTEQLNIERRLDGWAQLTMFDDVPVIGLFAVAAGAAGGM